MRSRRAGNVSCRFCQVSTITSPRSLLHVTIEKMAENSATAKSVWHQREQPRSGFAETIRHTSCLAPIGRACKKAARRRKGHQCLNHAQQSLRCYFKYPRTAAICDMLFCTRDLDRNDIADKRTGRNRVGPICELLSRTDLPLRRWRMELSVLQPSLVLRSAVGAIVWRGRPCRRTNLAWRR